MNIKSFGQFVVDLLFPRRCPWCGEVSGKRACGCDDEVDALALPHCALPGPVLDEPWRLEQVWACYTYREPVRAAILRMKFENQRNLAVPIGRRLADKFDACGMGQSTEVLVPVPVSPKTSRARGYNQSALLAWELARHTGLPCLPNALLKHKETSRQSDLDRRGRLTNVSGAYSAGDEGVKGRRILLVDDILTTGSTLNECAKTLLQAGAAECRALCIAAASPELLEGEAEAGAGLEAATP